MSRRNPMEYMKITSHQAFIPYRMVLDDMEKDELLKELVGGFLPKCNATKPHERVLVIVENDANVENRRSALQENRHKPRPPGLSGNLSQEYFDQEHKAFLEGENCSAVCSVAGFLRADLPLFTNYIFYHIPHHGRSGTPRYDDIFAIIRDKTDFAKMKTRIDFITSNLDRRVLKLPDWLLGPPAEKLIIRVLPPREPAVSAPNLSTKSTGSSPSDSKVDQKSVKSAYADSGALTVRQISDSKSSVKPTTGKKSPQDMCKRDSPTLNADTARPDSRMSNSERSLDPKPVTSARQDSEAMSARQATNSNTAFQSLPIDGSVAGHKSTESSSSRNTTGEPTALEMSKREPPALNADTARPDSRMSNSEGSLDPKPVTSAPARQDSEAMSARQATNSITASPTAGNRNTESSPSSRTTSALDAHNKTDTSERPNTYNLRRSSTMDSSSFSKVSGYSTPEFVSSAECLNSQGNGSTLTSGSVAQDHSSVAQLTAQLASSSINNTATAPTSSTSSLAGCSGLPVPSAALPTRSQFDPYNIKPDAQGKYVVPAGCIVGWESEEDDDDDYNPGDTYSDHEYDYDEHDQYDDM